MSTPSLPFHELLTRGAGLSQSLRRSAASAEEEAPLAEVLSQTRSLAASRIDSTAIEARGGLGRELLDALGQLGLFGITVPESHGGAGLSLKGAASVVSELAAFDGSVAACVGLHSGLALHALLRHATDSLRDTYLSEIAEGRRIVSFAATEPSAGSEISAVKTTLSRSSIDGSLRLDGSKCYVTNGGIAGLLTVLARSPEVFGARAGYSLVLVDPSWLGVSRGREEHKLGLRGSSTITYTFEDVSIPRSHILGDPTAGLLLAHEALARGRTLMAAGCLGTAKAAIAHAKEHTASRIQFGKPLLAQPLVRGSLAAAEADWYVMETLVRLVGDLDAQGADIGLSSTIAKVMVSERAHAIVDQCLQLMGGAGYIEETGMPRRLRDVRVTRIFEGSNDVLRLHIASSVLGWSFDDAAALATLGEARVADLCKTAIAPLTLELADIRRRLGFRLHGKQSLQSAMADAIMSSYAALAVATRASGASERRERAIAAMALDRLLGQLAEARVRMAQDETTRLGWVEDIVGAMDMA